MWNFILTHVLPVLAAGAGGYIARGRRLAVTQAADAATDEAANAALKAKSSRVITRDERPK